MKRNHELLVENLSSLDIEVMPLLKDEVPSRFIVKANSKDQRDRLVKELKLFGIGASTELFFLCQFI